MDQVAHALFTALRQMDVEAGLNKEGNPTGLNWYSGYAKPETSKQIEPCWTQRLAYLLPKKGIPCRAEVIYPGESKRCDLVISLNGGEEFWLKIKGAWKSYWKQKNNLSKYRSYLLYLPESGKNKIAASVANDLRKLEQLKTEDARSIGLLLVGFATHDSPMDNDVEELIQQAELSSPRWNQWHDSWDDVHRDGERIQCWLWIRGIKRYNLCL